MCLWSLSKTERKGIAVSETEGIYCNMYNLVRTLPELPC